MKVQQSQAWYAIIASVLLISFLIVLVSGTLTLIVGELKDSKGRQDYLRAFYAAEWGLEMALYDIKEKWYGYTESGSYEYEDSSANDPKISYEFISQVKNYTDSLWAGETVIIPLFTIDNAGVQSVDNLELSGGGTLSWNIIGQESGLSGLWDFSTSTNIDEKIIGGKAVPGTIGSFLSSNSGSYLMLVNTDNTDVSYALTSSDYFTRPVADILSSGVMAKYQQNLTTSVDNTEFLGILRYSIYSDF